MASLDRWDPIRDMTTLRDAMGQLLEQAVLRPGYGFSPLSGSTIGQMNVFETGDHYICQVLLPGVTADAVELTVRQNTLALKATIPELVTDDQRKSATYLLREFGAGEFTRSIAFPKDVNGSAVEARFDRGVLTIAIPLAQHAQPRRITISEGEASATPRNQSQLTNQPSNSVVEQSATPNHVGAHA